MPDHTYSALRAHERTTSALMADPDVTGDLLLIGLWLSRAVHLRTPAPTSTSGDGWQLTDIADDLFPLATQPGGNAFGRLEASETGPNVWKVVDVVKRDIRRYDVWADQPGGKRGTTPCGGPMIRREVCGKRAHTWSFSTDPETGRRRLLGACSRHMDWYWQQRRENQAALAGIEVPRPPANAGGCLARHINIDWPALWQGLDPEWTAPPEVDSWVRPKLKLLAGKLDARPDSGLRAPRPRFAVIDGAMTTSAPVLT